MKFAHSERVLHDIQFNPPCNQYNIDKNQGKTILTGSLAGPILLNNDKNTFGYEKRFQNISSKLGPGPGEYFALKKQLMYDFKTNLSNPKHFLKNTFRQSQKNPSIPYKIISQQNLDEKDKFFLKELSLIQNPAKAVQKIRKKQPSFSFTKSPRKLISQIDEKNKQKQRSKISMGVFRSDLLKIEQKYQDKPIFEDRSNKNDDQNKKTLIIYNDAIRKASKKRNQIINNIGPQFVPSLELIDLMSKMRTKYVPGPGAYNRNNENSWGHSIQNFQQSVKKGAIFSTVKRFDVDKKNILGPGSYEVNYDSLSKKGGLIPKQKRNLFNMKEKTDLQYRFYINPDSQSKINVNAQLQRSNSCASFRRKNISQNNQLTGGFGSSSKRFTISAASSNEQDKKSQFNEYEQQKKKAFKIQLKARLKKLNSDDRRSTKQDSGLLGISTIASVID